MGNRYSSVERRIWSKNVYSEHINPPNDFVIPVININRLFLFPQESINVNSLVRLINIGLFCNFADGLVYKFPDQKIEFRIGSLGLVKDTISLPPHGRISGLLTVNANDATIEGHGQECNFLTELSIDNFILINHGDDVAPLHYIYKIKHIFNEHSLLIYPPITLMGSLNYTGYIVGYKLRGTTGSAGFSLPFDIHQLNTMTPCEYILNPLTISNVKYDYLAIMLSMKIHDPMYFLTKSIDTTYTGNWCIFDVAIDIECTP